MSVLGGAGKPAELTLESIMSEVNKNLEVKVKSAFDEFKKTGLSEAIKGHIDPVTNQLGTINSALEKLLAGGGTPPPADPGAGKSQVPPEVNAQLKEQSERLRSLGTEITTLKTAKEVAEKRAEETERHSAIRTALQGLPFVSEKAAETAFQLVLPNVKRLEDQSLVAGVGGDNFPIDAFSRDFLQKDHAYLMRASGNGGSGAPTTQGQMRMGARADIDSIKVGMKPDDRQAAVDAINAVMAAA